VFPTVTKPDNESTGLPTHNENPNDWDITTTTTYRWGTHPAAPSPLLSTIGQPRTNDYTSLHWTACYDDYCSTHYQSMDNNNYPRQSRRCHRAQTCDFPLPHPNKLLDVTRE